MPSFPLKITLAALGIGARECIDMPLLLSCTRCRGRTIDQFLANQYDLLDRLVGELDEINILRHRP